MRQITISIDDDRPGAEMITTTAVAKLLKSAFYAADLTIDAYATEITIVPPRTFTDITLEGDLYAKLKKAAKSQNISVLELLERSVR